jgi:hypothetical protein
MDGVRQDFIIPKRPVGSGPLRVKLEVTGGTAEPLADSAQLVLEKSGRKINYNRLRVTDATGKELTARMEVVGNRESQRDSINQAKVASPRATLGEPNARDPHETTLAVLVDDIEAVYPMRIDPTFSDANWISMGGLPGADGGVHAAVVDGSGNLYIGGDFTIVGEVAATNIAKWNGSSWTALGSGIEGRVYALAVSGNDLYAGGEFGTAGGGSANYIAKWNGSGWSALGSGVNSPVFALAVSGTNVYAGGNFTTAGGRAANYIAKWDGTSWSALGSGMGGGSPVFLPVVAALAVSGSHLYAGGFFKTAGGASATNIAKWNGSSWSALGSGMNNTVYALAVSASDLYAGGYFTTAGGNPANRIAKWNGTGWSALGSGLDGGSLGAASVLALAVSGSDVYVGGIFTMAGSHEANSIAKWNGSSWSALGSGMGGDNHRPVVYALAVSGSDLYAGGRFTMAGGSPAKGIAKWNGSTWSPLGSGIIGGYLPYVNALTVWGSDLYVGGHFTAAGGKVSAYIARAYLPTLPTLSVLRSITDVMVSWPSVDTAGFALEQSGILAASASWVTNASSVTDDGTNKSVTLPRHEQRAVFPPPQAVTTEFDHR